MIVIALDGPAGSGKSTVAKSLSRHLNIEYIDSGAIYRTLTLYGMKRYENTCVGHEQEIADYFADQPDEIGITYQSHSQKMWLKEDDVSQQIRDVSVTRQVKHIADNPACREIVNRMIRNLAERYSVVIDGRDIGTKVFPDAPYKFYLDAKPEIRATRRAKELNIPLEGEKFENLLQEILERDRTDMARAIAPLCKADDAVYLDTSLLNVEEVVEALEGQLDFGA
ncbi:MAG: (d)CMP kinase [Proteobacteria bacterium]|nr:(d)CMP kinase [Pseudomonadota bacterium]